MEEDSEPHCEGTPVGELDLRQNLEPKEEEMDAWVLGKKEVRRAWKKCQSRVGSEIAGGRRELRGWFEGENQGKKNLG